MQLAQPESQPLGRYSFLMSDPFEVIVEPVGGVAPFTRLKQLLDRYKTDSIPDLPPMQGGAAGLFSYDLNRSIESIAPSEYRDFELPAIVLGFFDVVLAWDHLNEDLWLISQGLPDSLPAARLKQARDRLEYFEGLLSQTPRTSAEPSPNQPSSNVRELTMPTFSSRGPECLQSNFAEADYVEAVERCIEYVHAGDVFQINLAQQLVTPTNQSPDSLYLNLKRCNPAPFAGYFDLSQLCDLDAQIISASPERFFSVRDGLVETRPIKGTRKRTGRPMVDIQAREELLASEKDRAENTMIVDLMRNDLSKVCADESIRVTQLCELEEYQSVLHLVSAVQGKLRPEHGLVDLLEAVFPGGSITGAPKVRAMEIISELEPSARGAYCGALGYLGFDGTADLNLLIRTITKLDCWMQIPVGGGIVSQSIAAQELEETWTKAAGMLAGVFAHSSESPVRENEGLENESASKSSSAQGAAR